MPTLLQDIHTTMCPCMGNPMPLNTLIEVHYMRADRAERAYDAYIEEMSEGPTYSTDPWQAPAICERCAAPIAEFATLECGCTYALCDECLEILGEASLPANDDCVCVITGDSLEPPF